MSEFHICRRGFTLIELLVVISIISLLISILLPALAASREATKTMLCSNRQRQICIAYHAYAQDNNDWLNPARMDSPQWWNGVVSARPYYERIAKIGPYSPSGYQLTFKEKNVNHSFSCPTEERTFMYSSIGVNGNATGVQVSGVWPTYKPQRFGNFQIPLSSILLLADNTRIPPEHSAEYAVNWPSQAAFRHPGKNAVVAFTDGHSVNRNQETLTDNDFAGFLQ